LEDREKQIVQELPEVVFADALLRRFYVVPMRHETRSLCDFDEIPFLVDLSEFHGLTGQEATESATLIEYNEGTTLEERRDSQATASPSFQSLTVRIRRAGR
jgi:hypothetical protein